MYLFSEEVSSAEEILTAHIQNTPISEYRLKKLKYPDVHIPDRGAAIRLSFMPEDAEEKVMLRRKVEEYNQFIVELESIPGFVDAFIKNNYFMSKEAIAMKWSEETADFIFSKPGCIFSTDLRINENYIFDCSVHSNYRVLLDGNTIDLPIGENATHYCGNISGKTAIWNWSDNGHDFCFYLWDILGARVYQNEEADDDDCVSYSFDYYDQIRDDDVEPQLVRIYRKLESLGYIQTYTIKPEKYDPLWKLYCKSDGSIDLAIIDKSFMKNRLLMEQIEILLWTSEENLKTLPILEPGIL